MRRIPDLLFELFTKEPVIMYGHTGVIEYLGRGNFDIQGQEWQLSKVSLVVGDWWK